MARSDCTVAAIVRPGRLKSREVIDMLKEASKQAP